MLRSAETQTTRRLTGALPIVVGLALVAGAVLLLSPAARHELTLSTTRTAEPYVELYFQDEAAARSCAARRGKQDVSAQLRSHLVDPETLPYVIEVTEAGKVTDRIGGQVATAPGATAVLDGSVSVPADGDYDVSVALADRGERLVLHCGKPQSEGS